MTINNFNDFTTQHPITSLVVGLPSGEVIETSTEVFIELKKNHYIRYNAKVDAFTYSDHNYIEVLKIATKDKDKDNIEIEDTLHFLGIENYVINKDNSVDVFSNVDISQRSLKKLPIKFNKIEGDFDCTCNSLNTLVNAPLEVSGFFDCSINKLYSLIRGPKIVKGGYYCSDNFLEDLQGFPITCLNFFNAERNKLKSLKGSPLILECDDFNVSQNELVDLKGAPMRVKNFDCSYNNIKTLENGVMSSDGVFDCTNNKLTSLVGKPRCKIFIYKEGNKIKIND
jgi:hypothetical protein